MTLEPPFILLAEHNERLRQTWLGGIGTGFLLGFGTVFAIELLARWWFR